MCRRWDTALRHLRAIKRLQSLQSFSRFAAVELQFPNEKQSFARIHLFFHKLRVFTSGFSNVVSWLKPEGWDTANQHGLSWGEKGWNKGVPAAFPHFFTIQWQKHCCSSSSVLAVHLSASPLSGHHSCLWQMSHKPWRCSSWHNGCSRGFTIIYLKQERLQMKLKAELDGNVKPWRFDHHQLSAGLWWGDRISSSCRLEILPQLQNTLTWRPLSVQQLQLSDQIGLHWQELWPRTQTKNPLQFSLGIHDKRSSSDYPNSYNEMKGLKLGH